MTTSPWRSVAAAAVGLLITISSLGSPVAGPTTADSDGDGLLDVAEGGLGSGAPDTDGDSIIDAHDLDSDDDGIWDLHESTSRPLDSNDDGIVDSNDDADSDGVVDPLDPDQGGQPLSPPDRDNDGELDPYDPDDDGDQIATRRERTVEANYPAADSDGIPAHLDTDSDDDSIDDIDETDDIDADGVPDFVDADQDFVARPTAFRVVSNSLTVAGTTGPFNNVRIELFDHTGASLGSITPAADPNGDFSRTYSAGWPTGNYTLVVTSFESTGARFSQSIPIIVNRAFVEITAPRGQAVRADSTPWITGRAEPGALVELEFGASSGPVASVSTVANTDGDFFVFAPQLQDATYSLTARATNSLAYTASESVTFEVDTTDPALDIDAPSDGESVGSSSFQVGGAADASTLVTVTLDGASSYVATASAGGGWATSTIEETPDGWHQATAICIDDAGNRTVTDSTFRVDTEPPTAVIWTPVDGAVFDLAAIEVRGMVEPGSTAALQIDDTERAVDVEPDGQWAAVLSLSPGSHEIWLHATDRAGNSSVSDSVQIERSRSGSNVQISRPATNRVVAVDRPDWSGFANPDQRVWLRLNGTSVGSAVADDEGRWTFGSNQTIPVGLAVVQAATTPEGPAAASATVEVDHTLPTLVVEPVELSTPPVSVPTIYGFSDPGTTISVSNPAGEMTSTVVDADGDWELRTPPLPDGVTHVPVVAEDSAGNRSVVDARVDLDTEPPAVAIDHPDRDATKSTSRVGFEGVTEPGNTVEVSMGFEVGSTTADLRGRWFVAGVAVRDGGHTAEVRVTDSFGNETFTLVDYIVDQRAPYLIVTTPDERGVVREDQPLLGGNADPGATVEVSIDGHFVGRTVASQSGEWTLTAPDELADGVHVVRAEAEGVDGVVGNDEHIFVVDTRDAFVEILQPRPGATTADITPVVSGRTRAFTEVRLEVDDRFVGTATSDLEGRWRHEIGNVLQERPHRLVASVGSAEDSVQFFIDASAPRVEIERPLDGSVTNERRPRIAGHSEPGARVSLRLDGEDIGSVDADESGRWELESTPSDLSDATHVVTARSSDSAGNIGRSGEVSFRVDTIPPDLAVDAPTDGETFEPGGIVATFGTSEPTARITTNLDGDDQDYVLARGDGAWNSSLGYVAPGEHVLVVSATDRAGNVTSVGPVLFTVESNAQPPVNDDERVQRLSLAGGCSHGGEGGPFGAWVLCLLALAHFRRRGA